jgi:hypothetical protein
MNFTVKSSLMLSVVGTALLFVADNTCAEDLNVLKKPLQTQVVPIKLQTSPPIILAPSTGLKDAKQASDSGLTRTPFSHRISTDSIELHIESLSTSANNQPLEVKQDPNKLDRPIKKTKEPLEAMCTPPQVSNGMGKCIMP